MNIWAFIEPAFFILNPLVQHNGDNTLNLNINHI
jgi:hypothetical protein